MKFVLVIKKIPSLQTPKSRSLRLDDSTIVEQLPNTAGNYVSVPPGGAKRKSFTKSQVPS